MVSTCSITYCKTGYKRKGQVAEYHPAFWILKNKTIFKRKMDSFHKL